MKDLHTLQIQILKKLIFTPKLKFTELRVSDIPNNQLDFHLKELLKLNYILKQKDLYILTESGKEFCARIDTDKLTVKKQAKLSSWFIPIKGDEVLVYTRLKQPFYGCQGFGGGKIDYGEGIADAAEREFKEETNLTGKATIVGNTHYFVYDKTTKELLEDKIMYLCRMDNVKGDLVCGEEGKYEWVKIKDLKKHIKKYFETWEAFQTQLDTALKFDGNIKFYEVKSYVTNF